MAPGLLAVLAIAALFLAHAVEFRFTQDDAYISLRYASNLVEGHGLVFNPGERVEGYSNFSWTLLLALLIKLGAPPVETSTWLGVLFGVGAILAAARLARALEGGWGGASVGTAALVAGNSAFALWSTGGLETAMFTFLATAGLERGLAPGVGSRGRLAAPALLCLAALTRPDGPLLFVLWFTVRAADTLRLGGPAAHAEGRRGLVRDALVFGLPLVPYALWKLVYYGDLLPNTYYAKAGMSAAYVVRGVGYAADFFRAYGIGGVAPAVALLALARGGRRSVEIRLLFIWAGFALYVIAIGGDVLYLHRFWLPILPIGAVLVARGATRAGEWVAARRAVRGQRLPRMATTALLTAGLAGIGLATNWETTHERRDTETGFVENMTQTGEWLGRNLPPGSRIAITTVGAISYYSGLRVIDLLGLTDREIARNPAPIEGLADTWREIKYNAESVLRRRPDMILFSTGVRPSSAAEKALFLYESFYETYYGHYFRSVPSRRSTQVAFRLRPDAPPFRPDRLQVPSFEFLDEYGLGHIAQSRHHDYKAASEHFRRAWELSGGAFPLAKEWLGAALYDSEKPGGLEILREVAAEDAYSVVALSRVAENAVRAGDLEEAERLFGRITTFDADDSVPWMGLAELARLRGDLETAYLRAIEGIRRWNSNSYHLVGAGNLAARVGKLDQAKWCYERALRFEPGLEEARRGLTYVARARQGTTAAPRAPAPVATGERVGEPDGKREDGAGAR